MIVQAEVGEAEAAARAERFPVGAAVEFEDLERADRVEVFDRLRAAEPVSWVPAMGGWLVTSYAHARSVLGPRSPFTVEAAAEPGAGLARPDDADRRRCLRTATCATPFEAPFHRRAVEERFRRAGDDARRGAARRDRAHGRMRSRGRRSRRRLRSALPATCSVSRSTTCRASAGSTTRSPAAWCTTAIPSRSGSPTPRGPSSAHSWPASSRACASHPMDRSPRRSRPTPSPA